MPGRRLDAAFLWDMLEASRKIERFTNGIPLDEYMMDEQLRYAVERLVEIVGEAARNVSPEFKSAHPEIPWQGIISQRNVIAHDYGGIRHDLLWRIATVHVPNLIKRIGPLLPPLPPEIGG